MKERYLLEEEVGENGFSLITDYDGNDEHAGNRGNERGEYGTPAGKRIEYR